MCSMHALEMEVAGKPDASFPTTTNNNNNFVYTNRNAYNQEQMNDHADAQRKESQDSTDSTDGGSQLNNGGLHAGNVQIAATAEREAIPTTTANGNPSCKKIARPSHRISGNLSQTLRALLDAIKKFKRHRRPVNDFLMFCKVHRGKVSAHFTAKAAPKENRFITRKLGLWWGLLTQEQKQPYKLLADKYKAMYLAAFPEYRWGKSQHHQPSEVSDAGHVGSSSSEAFDDESAVELELEDGNLEAARCLVEMAGGFGLPLSGFRLADETQMGSLSALLPSRVTMDTESSVGAFEHNYSAAQPFANDGAQDLRVANNRGEPCANMRQHFLAQTKPNPEQPAMSSGSSTGPARASRTCKGKRYEAFMQKQHPTRHQFSPGRNKRPRTTSSSSITATTTTTTAAAAASVTVPVAPADPSTSTTSRVASAGPEVGAQDLDERAILAWLSDYDKLNEEIAKLPVFDLNEFLAKQKCDKRRKKPYAVSSKAARKRKTSKSSIPSPSADVIDAPSISSSPAPPPVVPPVVASVTVSSAETAPVPTTPQRSTVPAKIVGCRKRKAPKENIIRNPVL